jgi:hypothetical protein
MTLDKDVEKLEKMLMTVGRSKDARQFTFLRCFFFIAARETNTGFELFFRFQ